MRKPKKPTEVLIVLGVLLLIGLCWLVFHSFDFDGTQFKFIYQEF